MEEGGASFTPSFWGTISDPFLEHVLFFFRRNTAFCGVQFRVPFWILFWHPFCDQKVIQKQTEEATERKGS